MGLSRTVSEIDGDFIRKLLVFPTAVYFMPPLTGLPSELSMAQGRKLEDGAIGGQKTFHIALVVWRQHRRVTDRRTSCSSKDRAMRSVAWAVNYPHNLCINFLSRKWLNTQFTKENTSLEICKIHRNSCLQMAYSFGNSRMTISITIARNEQIIFVSLSSNMILLSKNNYSWTKSQLTQ